MRILIVEDDYLQIEALKGELEKKYKDAILEIITTELEFRDSISKIELNPPDVILMDVMLRWTNPSPGMVLPPPEIKKAGFFTAGFRCNEMLKSNAVLKHIPVIFFTVLDEDDLALENQGKQALYIAKNNDYSALLAKIKVIVNRSINSSK